MDWGGDPELEELYKWKLVTDQIGHPDVNAVDFAKEINSLSLKRRGAAWRPWGLNLLRFQCLSAFLNFHRTPIFQKSQYLRIHRRFSPFSTQLYRFRLAPSEPPATSPRVVRTSPGLVFSKPGLVSPVSRVKNPECQVVPAAHAVACEGLKKAWWMLEESTVNAWWRICGDYAIYVNFPLFTVHPFTKCAFPAEYQGETVWRLAVTSLHSGAWSQGAVRRFGNASLHTVSHWKSRINAYDVKGWTVKRGKFTYIA